MFKNIRPSTLFFAVVFNIMLAGIAGITNSLPAIADSTPSLIHFSWIYILGTGTAICWKAWEGVIKYVPAKQFSILAYLSSVLISLPILLVSVFFFLPVYGPPTGHWRNDLVYSFLTAYTIIGMASSYEDYRKFQVYFMEYFKRKFRLGGE